MRVGVYIDGYNLYYGGRMHFGRGTPGWKWLDVRGLAQSLAGWPGASVARVVYCTARINAVDNPSAATDQDIYLQALVASGSVDVLEEGRYVARLKKEPLATQPKGQPLSVFRPPSGLVWDPILPLESGLDELRHPMVLAHVRRREEKGSDVNVATHLLVDALSGAVDATIVVTNDSDLALPIRMTRDRISIGVVNPGTRALAGALSGHPGDGIGGHWWTRLQPADYRAHQLPAMIGQVHKPAQW